MPSLRPHPYRGLWAAIATMHEKERAIAPALCHCFDMTVTTAPGVDTDALGTFSGEIRRKGSMRDAARQKAEWAIARTGAPLGIGSEGAFGPDPELPFIASGLEVLVLLAADTHHEIMVSRRTPTNFDNVVAGPGDDISPFLKRVGFPAHAVVVRPEGNDTAELIAKGIRDEADLRRAMVRALPTSPSGRVCLSTDMRAHLNRTRMQAIARTAQWLAAKIARCCPRCGTPGFGIVDLERGLPCRDCGTPTRLITAEIYGCQSCGVRLPRHQRSPQLRSDPTWCENCNP